MSKATPKKSDRPALPSPNRPTKSAAARPLKLWQDVSTPQEVRIEIIPLIDVIFCILTFFILAAVGFSRQQAINLNLPKASTGTPQMREMLVVSLDDLGQVYVEQQIVTRSQLSQAIKNYHQLNPSGLMVLNAAKNVSYNEVIEILDLLREVGGDRVALATLPGESDSTSPVNPYGDLPGFGNGVQPNLPTPEANPVPPLPNPDSGSNSGTQE